MQKSEFVVICQNYKDFWIGNDIQKCGSCRSASLQVTHPSNRHSITFKQTKVQMRKGIIRQTPTGWTILYSELRPEVKDAESGDQILPAKITEREIPIAIQDHLQCQNGKEVFFSIAASGNLHYARIEKEDPLTMLNILLVNGFEFKGIVIRIDRKWYNKIIWTHKNQEIIYKGDGWDIVEEAIEDAAEVYYSMKLESK